MSSGQYGAYLEAKRKRQGPRFTGRSTGMNLLGEERAAVPVTLPKLQFMDGEILDEAAEAAALAGAPAEARAVVLADKLHNLLSIACDLRDGRLNGVVAIPPDFSRRTLARNDPRVALVEDNTDTFVSSSLGATFAGLIGAYNDPAVASGRIAPQVSSSRSARTSR